ncbi:kinase-like domain-containing protein [Gautieria morchelliformis]|nr:kinase-like domain-containing protein [Gautieria morchelliformis]
MPLSWTHRVSLLCDALGTNIITDDEERQGQALDQHLTSRTKERRANLDSLRFTDEDLNLIGTLAVGQFGVVDVVRCRLDSKVYVRKTIEKHIAMRARGQCSPQLERDILVKALTTNSFWAPHLLCAFQTETALKFVMEYADGGNLWDVIESSPDGKISEQDLKWWTPQIVSAIDWCHSQGFVHRDIKPHNFVLTPTSHLLLVDFGSAAPLSPPSQSGVQLVPKEHCLVPCGTCDYISPEVLRCHEEALVALELDDHRSPLNETTDDDGGAYGRETDWWSFGAMVYEMAFGVAPFFAHDIGHTYIKIVEHRSSLQLGPSTNLSTALISLLQGVLCDKEHRLGRHSVSEIKDHVFFQGVDWIGLHQQDAPNDIRLPQFTYSAVASNKLEDRISLPEEGEEGEEADMDHFSRPFAFSALFQSSRLSPGSSILRGSPACNRTVSACNLALNSFIGFSWGPRISAFSPQPPIHDTTSPARAPLHREPVNLTPRPAFPVGITGSLPHPQTDTKAQAFRTPVRTNSVPLMHHDGHTVSMSQSGTGRRMQGKRPMSDREAMQQLVECVGMSARKKVFESGQKPTHIRTASGRLGSKKDVRPFVPIPKPLVIGTRINMSTTTSESESQPPSPTPRPGSALSRRSGWGGRSTPSLLVGRSTPTLTFTATGTGTGAGATGSGSLTSGFAAVKLTHTATSFDEKLQNAERRHDRLLDKIASLQNDICLAATHLKCI